MTTIHDHSPAGQSYGRLELACVTEQTRDIRMHGMCDGARFAVSLCQIFS